MEILKDEYNDEDFDRVTTAHDRMEQIIEELLLLARSGQLIDEPETVSLADLVEQCWSNVETERAHLKVVNTSQIVADPHRLQHLFENLFRNAIEHGGPDVTVRVGALQNGFYIEDDGPGIQPDEVANVSPGGPTRRGLGLQLVEWFVEHYDGDLDIETGRDRGSVITIGLPRASAPHPLRDRITTAQR
jgi:signal transduction histidine kinase